MAQSRKQLRTIGLVTKHTGIDRGRNAAAGLHGAPEVKLVALFSSPERGIRSDQDHEKIGDTIGGKKPDSRFPAIR